MRLISSPENSAPTRSNAAFDVVVSLGQGGGFASVLALFIQNNMMRLWTPLKTSSLCWLAGKLFSRTAEYLVYLRIAESSLTHQTTRIKVFRGVHKRRTEQSLRRWMP